MNRWIVRLLALIGAGILLLFIVGFITHTLGTAEPTPIIITPTLDPALVAAAQSLTATAAYITPSLTPSATPSPTPAWTPTPRPSPRPADTVTPTPSLTPTPTMTPSPPPLVLPVVTLPVFASTPVVTSPYPQPTQMPLIQQPPGTVNILLLGSDQPSGTAVGRTDVIVIASIYPDLPSVSLISVPRDYYAWIPGWGLDKINTAHSRASRIQYPGGGPALIKDTIAYNFGIPIHFYALVNFSSYRSIVDAVGGVDLVIECPFHDTYPDAESVTGQTDIDLEPGVHHLDGKFALWYVRSRWNTSDFDRHRRQQQVLLAIMHQALNQNMISRIPDLWSVYKDNVITDMALTDILALVPAAVRLDERDIKSRFIRGSELLTAWTAPNGGYVLVPNYDLLFHFISEAAQPQVTSRAAQRAYRVLVMNGTGNSGWGQVAAYRLGLERLEVISVQDVGWEARTTLVDFTTTRKGSPLGRLMLLYKLSQED
ncbi:MAG: LCP family protein, partial [Anaerolineae bacterium]|nr:LCP family protein [Anaerolineae bacterium]